MTFAQASRLDQAHALLAQASDRPSETLPQAQALADLSVVSGDLGAVAVAHRAAGLCHLMMSDLPAAMASLEAAEAHAQRLGDSEILGGVEMTAAAVHGWAGDNDAAMDLITRSVGRLAGIARARAQVQRGTVRYRIGDLAGALDDFEAAHGVLVSGKDQMWVARLLANRGIVRGFQGDLRGGEHDLLKAGEILALAGSTASAAQVKQNLGWLLTRVGDLPRALAYLDEAEADSERVGRPPYEVWGDRVDAMVAAHLTRDAKQLASRAVAAFDRGGFAAAAAENRLRLAQAALMDRDVANAVASADEAIASFAGQDRPNWQLYARYLRLSALALQGTLSPDHAARVGDLAVKLHAAGFWFEEAQARLVAARLDTEGGRTDSAIGHLARVAEHRRSGSVELRIAGWLATAQARILINDFRGAATAARAGLAQAEHWQALLGSAELRAQVMIHAEELALICLRQALAGGRPRVLFEWLERTRAGALRFAPVRPPDDRELASELAQMRKAEEDARRARLDGTQPANTQQLASLRAAVRRRSLRRRGDGVGAEHTEHPPVAAVRDQLELIDGVLVEYGSQNRHFFSIVVDQRFHKESLGDIGRVETELALLRTALSRMSQKRGSPMAREAARRSAEAALTSLDHGLIPSRVPGDGPVVIVPPVALHAVPWGLLPSLRGRAITVAPSARVWLDRMRRPQRRRTGVVVASGPDLPGAASESRRIAEVHSKVSRFTARTSKVEAVLEALDGAELAHIVAHGSFRSDNPLFSSLRLADGGLTVYDLERVDRMPPTMVLSACNSGLQAVRPGDETMGIVAALLAAGCRTVVASTGLVPDTGRTARTMVDFHRRLVAGEAPAAALATAQAAAIASGPDGMASAPFVCFGAG